MTDIRAQLANVLRDHSEVWDKFTKKWVCTCDTWTGDDLGYYWNHVADVLVSLPGIAIVELPEPQSNGHALRATLSNGSTLTLTFTDLPEEP